MSLSLTHFYFKNFFLLALILFIVNTNNQAQEVVTYVEQVKPIAWKKICQKAKKQTNSFTQEVTYLLKMSNKFAVNKWYNEIKNFNTQSGKYLYLGGKTEHFIRPIAHEAFALSFSLQMQLYDPEFTEVSESEAREKTIKLICSLAASHKCNAGEKGWGDQWQSALWASQAATAAWFLWDDLKKHDKLLVSNMLLYEADRFLDYTVPYYQDKEGNIIFKGDTKAEENAWNSNILTIATIMFPHHPHFDQWMQKSIELQISAYSTPSDLQKDYIIDGYNLKDVLQGSNINDDGTAVNHNRIHPDYMCAIMHNTTNNWLYQLAGKPGLKASTYNGELVYQALTCLKFGDKTIYTPTPDGKASPLMYFPEGNDWGEGRQDGYWLMDIMAHVYKWDNDIDIKAIEWAQTRNKKMLEMISRDTSGQYYQSKSENSFASREEWFAAQLTFGYLGFILNK